MLNSVVVLSPFALALPSGTALELQPGDVVQRGEYSTDDFSAIVNLGMHNEFVFPFDVPSTKLSDAQQAAMELRRRGGNANGDAERVMLRGLYAIPVP